MSSEDTLSWKVNLFPRGVSLILVLPLTCLMSLEDRVVRHLGTSACGMVVEAEDFQTPDRHNVAIKILHRSVDREEKIQRILKGLVCRGAKYEIPSVSQLRDLDIHSRIAQMMDNVLHLGYRCLVYPLYGPTLRDVIAEGSRVPLSGRQIREVVLQIAQGLQCKPFWSDYS